MGFKKKSVNITGRTFADALDRCWRPLGFPGSQLKNRSSRLISVTWKCECLNDFKFEKLIDLPTLPKLFVTAMPALLGSTRMVVLKCTFDGLAGFRIWEACHWTTNNTILSYLFIIGRYLLMHNHLTSCNWVSFT